MENHKNIIESLQKINGFKSSQEVQMSSIDIEMGCFVIKFDNNISTQFIDNISKLIEFDIFKGFDENSVAIILDKPENLFRMFVEIVNNFTIVNIESHLYILNESFDRMELLCSTEYDMIQQNISIAITDHYE